MKLQVFNYYSEPFAVCVPFRPNTQGGATVLMVFGPIEQVVWHGCCVLMFRRSGQGCLFILCSRGALYYGMPVENLQLSGRICILEVLDA